MATKTVTGKLTDGAGVAIVGATVKARLSAQAVIASTQEIATTEVVGAVTGASGTWSLTLEANADLLPATTYWTILLGSDWRASAVVPSTAGPFTIEDIMSAIPAAAPPGALDSQVVHLALAETITGVKDFSAAPIFSAGFTVSAGQIGFFGTGDNVAGYAGTATLGQLIDVRKGTAGSPDTSDNPPVKISRTVNLASGTETSDGAWASAGLIVGTIGAATTVVPVTGIYSVATSISTAAGVGALFGDSVGVYGIGQMGGAGIWHAIGGAFVALNNSSWVGAQAQISGLQIFAINQTTTDATVNATGFSGGGIYIAAGPSYQKVGAAIEISNTGAGGHGAKAGLFDVGLHFNAQVSNGLTGAIDTAAIQDDSQGGYSYLINGTHANAAIAVKAGSGTSLFGGVTALNASSLLEVQGPASTKDGLVFIGSTANTNAYSIWLRNGAAITKWVIAATAGQFFTGSGIGDGALQAGTANKYVHLAGTTSVVKVGNDNTLSFFNAATTGQIAGATDVLAGLVTLGLRAASANPPLDLGTGALSAGSLVVPAGSSTSPAIHESATGANGFLMDGTHSGYGLAIASGAGGVLVGGTSALNASSLFEVQGPSSTKDGLVFIGSTANTNAYSIWFRNGAAITKLVIAASVDQFFTGSIAGDGAYQAGTANKFVHLAGTVSVVKVGNDNSLTLKPTLATAAGGAAAFSLGVTPALGLYFGSGAPTVSAPKGSLYLRTDGTTTNDRAYINTNASTTWTALTTAA